MYTKPQANYVFTLKRKADSVFEQLTGRPVKVARVELFEDVSIRVKKTTTGFQVEIDEPSQEFSSPANYSNNSDSDSSDSSSSYEMATVHNNRPWPDQREDSEEEAAREMRNRVYAGDAARASGLDDGRINPEQFLCYAHRNSSASTSCGPVTASQAPLICNGCDSLTCEDCRPFNLNLQMVHSIALSPKNNNEAEYSSAESEDSEESNGSESYRRWAEKQKNLKVDSVVSEESEPFSEESDAATLVMHTPKALPYSTHCTLCPGSHCGKCLTKNKYSELYSCCECHDAFKKVDLQRLYKDGHIANNTELRSTHFGVFGIIVTNDNLRMFVRIRAYTNEPYNCLCEWLVALGGAAGEDPLQYFEFKDTNGWHNLKTFIHQNY